MSIQKIKDSVDIVDIVSETVALKKRGNSYIGYCPFHENKNTPSFAVFPHSQTCYCFGSCGTGGDVISFVMQKDNIDFKEAVAKLSGNDIRANGIQIKKPKLKHTQPVDKFNEGKFIYDSASSEVVGTRYTTTKLIPIEILKQIEAKQSDDTLIFPLKSGGSVCGYHTIYPKKGDSRHKFSYGKMGSVIIGNLANDLPVLVGEGLATCASAYQATSYPVVVAMNVNRLLKVIAGLRKLYPTRKIINLVDIDSSGAGQLMILPISEQVLMISHAIPTNSKPVNSKSYDFNDLHKDKGLLAVRDRIQTVENSCELLPVHKKLILEVVSVNEEKLI
jgi:phage/plasmid primase-like uncharacterized protein